MKQVIALDVGGSSVKSARVTFNGTVVNEPIVTPIDSTAGAEQILSALSAIISQHLDEGVIGVSLGFPGPFDYDAGISRITGLAKYEAIYGLNVREALRDRIGQPALPIRFRNDAEAAVVGEARYGAGRQYSRLIGLVLGTGCGSTFLVNGKCVTTGKGIPPGGWLYPIPFRGHPADDVFSIRGLAARLEAGGVLRVSIKRAAEMARRGDRRVQKLFTEFGDDLAQFLCPFVRDFRPDALLILGGIGRAIDLFGPVLTERLPVPILSGRLGAKAALIGAARLFFEEQ